uniref:Cytochrome c oxidase subunit 3 n=1 Tax=Tanystylum orbiculare TaxID=88027 RepID=E0XLE5_TANOR|nr:cytochrome c oxidase subunit III [Tanystylum orbiculare]ADB91990.1 cytochrome c oxidase subunit III [Tanystylum orbiculare]
MTKKYHPFHIVDQSPWPLTGALGAMLMMVGLLELIYLKSMKMIIIGLLILMMTMYQWWRDIVRESTYQGHHTFMVINGLKLGMILFITSEVLFFLSFFWAFFHSSLAPNIELGMIWPPKGIQAFNPMSIPLLNTLILLSSGVTVTWCHHSILVNNMNLSKISLTLTVLLGLYFTILQGWEYWSSSFSFSDSSYGSTFFMATGFHGIHVIVGSTFLLLCLYRLMISQFSMIHNFGLEAAIWYWHFVDVVWLFLYTSIYWWGY